MLIDRFKLKYHLETEEDNAYVLTVDKGGLKMTQTRSQRTSASLGSRRATVQSGVTVFPFPTSAGSSDRFSRMTNALSSTRQASRGNMISPSLGSLATQTSSAIFLPPFASN